MYKCFLTVLLTTASVTFGAAVEYPLVGHFEHREGTIELWFTPTVELAANSDPGYHGLARLFELRVADGFTLGASCYSRHRRLMLGFLMAHHSDEKALLSLWEVLPEPLAAGQPLHLAFTWRDRVMSGYLNGRLMSTRKQARGFEGNLFGQTLRIGDVGPTPIVIQALRVSCVARDEAALRTAQPASDVFTLLLDRFDLPRSPETTGITQPQTFARWSGQTGGVLRGPWRFVDSPRPGIALDAIDQKEK